MASCPHCGEENPQLLAGHEIPGEYDGVLFWHCLSCGKAWRRIFGIKHLDLASRNHVIEWNSRGG